MRPPKMPQRSAIPFIMTSLLRNSFYL
jgi:hypothetical protein